MIRPRRRQRGRLDRVRRTALVVTVAGAVGTVASSVGVGLTTDLAVALPPPPAVPGLATGEAAAAAAGRLGELTGATTASSASGSIGATGGSASMGASGSTPLMGASGSTGAGGATSTTGASGSAGTTVPAQVTGSSGSTSATGTSGATSATGASGWTGMAGSTGATGPTQPTDPTGSTPGTDATGTSGAAGGTGSITAAVTPTAATGSTPTPTRRGTADTGGTEYVPTPAPGRRHHHRHATVLPPRVVGSTTQPRSGIRAASSTARTGTGSGAGVILGDTAPSPSLFSGSDPLAGVLPGSWEDPFIVAGDAAVPAFYVQSFHVPAFLLAIYEAAGSAYGIPWQTLAAINEVETDYGTNLDTSSAGAIGWMQFLPSTWTRYGVDATGTGSRDPYNAADAIFAAARYLAAAGAAHNLPAAIYAYNHSWNYVNSVLLRAELLSGEPTAVTWAVSELSDGDFPIQLSYHASYRPVAVPDTASLRAPSSVDGSAPAPSAVGKAAAASASAASGANIFADPGAAVVAAEDGTVVAIGHSRKLGRYIRIRNAFGDVFTYAGLGSLSAWYPVPKRQHGSRTPQVATAVAPGPRPNGPATAGTQQHGHPASGALFGAAHHGRQSVSAAATAGSPILPVEFTLTLRHANVFTPLSTLAPSLEQAPSTVAAAAPLQTVATAQHLASAHARRARTRSAVPSIMRYYTAAFGLRPGQLGLVPLRVGSRVLAGTILGRLSRSSGAHLLFELRPAATSTPVDPRPFLDAWSQLATVELDRHSFAPILYGADMHGGSVSALKIASQIDLARLALEDPRISLTACERTSIASGSVSRRVLLALELMSLRGVDVSVGGGWCASDRRGAGSPAVLKTGNAIAISSSGRDARSAALAAAARRALATLSGSARPQIRTTVERGKVVVSFAPVQQPRALAASAAFTGGFALSAARWKALDERLQQIAEPRVPTAVSRDALPDSGGSRPAR